MTRILVFGASTTYGCWDKQGGWVVRLRKYLEEQAGDGRPEYQVYNLGISGATSADILRRIDFETKQRLGRWKKDIITLISAGSNDSEYLRDQKRSQIVLSESMKNIKKCLEIAKKYSHHVLFVGLTPMDEDKTDPIAWNSNESFFNKDLERYTQAIKDLCRQENVYYIDLWSSFIKTDYQKLFTDGVHPNSDGHQNIFEAVKDFLIKSKII